MPSVEVATVVEQGWHGKKNGELLQFLGGISPRLGASPAATRRHPVATYAVLLPRDFFRRSAYQPSGQEASSEAKSGKTCMDLGGGDSHGPDRHQSRVRA